eukprot:SAG31_NODE_12231_length_957_cov_1.139860_2_plen_208_part_01
MRFNDTLIVGPNSSEICRPTSPGCYTNKLYRRWGILIEAHSPTLPGGHVQFTRTVVVDAPGWSSPPVWVEKPTGPEMLEIGFSDLAVNMSNAGPAITVSAILPDSGGVSVNGAVINRQCCPGGNPFLSARNSGNNQLKDVSVWDVTVHPSPNDTQAQAKVECNATLSSNAASNRVIVSSATCIKTDDHATLLTQSSNEAIKSRLNLLP